MKGPSTLVATLALAIILILEPTANAVVHRLTPTLSRRTLQPSAKSPSKGHMTPIDRLASHHGLDWTSAQQQRLQQQQKTSTSTDTTCDSGSSGSQSNGSRVNIDMDYGYALTAEMDIGSPAQAFEMDIVFGVQQPYVLKKGAKYSDDGTKVKGVEEFDVKSSTTAQQMNADFSPSYFYKSGSVVSDTIQLGALSTNQSVQVAKKVDPDFDHYAADGSLGLAVSNPLNGSSFVEQVAGQLDSPVFTLYTHQSLAWDDEGQGVLSFGDRLPETCKASSWTTMQSWVSHYGSWPAVDTVSVTGAPADSNGCGGTLTANITVGFYHAFMPIYCSVQLHEMFVKAAGARFDWHAYRWVVDDASKAVPVKFQTASGDVITVNPNDYLLEIDGTQYLNTYGYYDQNKYAEFGDYILLSQSFLNNHCLSMNMQSGEWSLADAKTSSEADYSSSSSASSSSSSMSVDDGKYINRKH